MKGLILATLFAGVGLLAPPPAVAQSTGLYCGQNFCSVGNPGGAVSVIWDIDPLSTDALFPANCTNQSTCVFRCPSQPGPILVTVSFRENGNLIATDSSSALCSEE